MANAEDTTWFSTSRSQAIQGCWERGLEEAQSLSGSEKVLLTERPHGADTGHPLFLISLPATLKAEILSHIVMRTPEIQKD